ncbi:YncE family protein [Flavobacterium sp.]|uniref:YncE family protein n=1 Tax=Flavobacterium sp. TaxID=239 RepID=UPI00374CA17B
MKFSKLFLVALMSFPLFFSCSNDEDVPVAPVLGAYENGTFILNEGSSGQGSVSFIGNDLTSFTQDVHAIVNPGDLFGKYVQSMFLNGDYAYIIAGGSNKINVVNRKTFKLVAKIETGLVAPRYGVVVNGKAYVTNANTYSYANPSTGNTDDYVAVINLTTNLVESTIPLNATANRILVENGKLYISEPYNNTKVLVVNPTTNTLETPLNVGSDADTMEVKNGFLYALRSPYGGPSEIVKVKLSDATTSTVVFPAALNDAKNLDIYESKIYYTVGTSVYAMDIAATTASTTAIFSYTSTSAYGIMYGFAVNGGRIYIADGGDFTANSKAYIYSLTGTLQKEMTVGVGPNGFYFN